MLRSIQPDSVLQSIRKLLKRDPYRPHTYLEMREIVGPDVLARLEPGGKYGVYWFGERAETRKRVSESGEGGRVYRHRYTSKVRPVADRIGVPVPDSGTPREWVDAARANLEASRRPANAGRRFWDLSAGILRCSECGRAMSPRTTSRTYFYYACTVGPSKRLDGCCAEKFHSATELEERVWSAVSAILADPKKLRTGLNEMIQHERAPDAWGPYEGGCYSWQEAPGDQESEVPVSGDGGGRTHRLRRAARMARRP